MAALGNQLISFLMSIVGALASLLPNCPFDASLTELENSAFANVMGMLNYVIPFYHFVPIATAWGVAILGWYIYTIPLRFGKIIE